MSGRLRTAALLGCGALSVHQLRYLLAHGDDASQALAREGHSYLGMLAPLIALVAGVALLDFLLTVVRRRTGTQPARRMRWIAATTTLLTIYASQETIEGLLSPGHPAGIDGLIGNGGWVAVPLAIAAGLVIALLLRSAERVIAKLLGDPPAPPVNTTPAVRRVATVLLAPRRSPLATKLAGRAPPHAFCS